MIFSSFLRPRLFYLSVAPSCKLRKNSFRGEPSVLLDLQSFCRMGTIQNQNAFVLLLFY